MEDEPVGDELPKFDIQKDVLVLPLDFDESTLNKKCQITLELLEEMGKVIRVQSLTKPAIIKVR